MIDDDQDPQHSAGNEQQGATPFADPTPAPDASPPDVRGEVFPPSFSVPSPVQPASFASPWPAPAIPFDLNVPWSWSDLLVFLLFYFACTTIFSLVIVFATAGAMHIGIKTMIDGHGVLFISLSIVAQALASLSSIFYLRMLVYARTPGSAPQPGEGPWQVLGWRRLGEKPSRAATVFKYVAAGIGLAYAVSFVSEFVGQRRKVPFEDLFQSRQTILMLMAFGILLAPVVEEMMFRGFLYPVVARRFGVAAGILTTGILFGAFHAMQLWGAWEQIALLAVVGIVLTWVRARSHTILASYIIHVAYNSTLFVGVLLATNGLRKFPAGN
ncbi:MAG TPA: CPBP family glutamic-type intramembrane protease [Candidatus Limnocylindrales bacterium]|nr:CPBP family glutamic-type intramembrane protease [Candidatus Limnocylindrales bacterium]